MFVLAATASAAVQLGPGEKYSHYTGLLPPLPGAANHLASPRAGDCPIVNSPNSPQMWGDGG